MVHTHLTVLRLNLGVQHGLGLRQMLTLGVLARRGEASFTELHSTLSIPKSALTGIVDGLDARGIVKRRQDRHDRRKWLVSLTPKGRRVVRQLHREDIHAMRPVLEQFSASERETLFKVLQTLSDPSLVSSRMGNAERVAGRRSGRRG